LARLLAHTLYRIDHRALTHVPDQGPALLIAGLSPRPSTFVSWSARSLRCSGGRPGSGVSARDCCRTWIERA
jgi:hypothetical protein